MCRLSSIYFFVATIKAIYIFALCDLLCHFKDTCWTIGSDRKCPINLGLFLIPPFRLSGSFLEISSLVFFETQYVVRGPCAVVHERVSLFWKKTKIVKNDRKMAFGTFM